MTIGHFYRILITERKCGTLKSTKASENKKLKRNRLYDAAFELFSRKGVNETVVDEIVKHAGIAKGTFYLYCKDKYDLVEKIILKRSAYVFENAMKALAEQNRKSPMDFTGRVIFFIDYLIEFFKQNSNLLSLIYKNLSWGLYEKAMNYEEIGEAKQIFLRHFSLSGSNAQTAKRRLFIVVSMVGAVCYNSLVLKSPYDIDDVKPELYRCVKKILAG